MSIARIGIAASTALLLMAAAGPSLAHCGSCGAKAQAPVEDAGAEHECQHAEGETCPHCEGDAPASCEHAEESGETCTHHGAKGGPRAATDGPTGG